MVLGPAEKNAQEYLGAAWHINKEIELNRQLLAQEQKRLQHLSKVLQHDFTQLPAYKKYVQQVENHIKKLQAERDNALFLISQIKDDRYRTVLELSYLHGMTAEAAAEQMHYSIYHFFRLRAEALHVAANLLAQQLERGN